MVGRLALDQVVKVRILAPQLPRTRVTPAVGVQGFGRSASHSQAGPGPLTATACVCGKARGFKARPPLVEIRGAGSDPSLGEVQGFATTPSLLERARFRPGSSRVDLRRAAHGARRSSRTETCERPGA